MNTSPRGGWIRGSLLVGLASVAVGAATSALAPNPAAVGLVGGGVGAGACSALVLRRRRSTSAAAVELSAELRSADTVAPPRLTVPAVAAAPGAAPPRPPSPRSPSTSSAEAPASAVVSWLADRGITVVSHATPDPARDPIFDRQALVLGKAVRDKQGQPLLLPLLKRLNWAVSNGRGLSFDLRSASQDQISGMTRVCSGLLKDSLLAEYRYRKGSKLLQVTVQDRGDIRSFFSGGWFERFVCISLQKALLPQRKDLAWLMNTKIIFPNGAKHELDLLVLIDLDPLLMECKSGGDYNAHLRKFSDHIKRLSIQPHQAMLVILDLPAEDSSRLSAF